MALEASHVIVPLFLNMLASMVLSTTIFPKEGKGDPLWLVLTSTGKMFCESEHLEETIHLDEITWQTDYMHSVYTFSITIYIFCQHIGCVCTEQGFWRILNYHSFRHTAAHCPIAFVWLCPSAEGLKVSRNLPARKRLSVTHKLSSCLLPTLAGIIIQFQILFSNFRL